MFIAQAQRLAGFLMSEFRVVLLDVEFDEFPNRRFGGSGNTLIGAEQTGRKSSLMELDPLYADVIVDRYQRFSGVPAVLERTGESPIPMSETT